VTPLLSATLSNRG